MREHSRGLQRKTRFLPPQIIGKHRQSLLASRSRLEIHSQLQENIRLPIGFLYGAREKQHILLWQLLGTPTGWIVELNSAVRVDVVLRHLRLAILARCRRDHDTDENRSPHPDPSARFLIARSHMRRMMS